MGNLWDGLVKAVLFPLQGAQLRTACLWLSTHLQALLLGAAAQFVPAPNTAHSAKEEMGGGEKE